ncbi:MAG: hypothetical protein ACXWZM_05055 [Solirubrobacterales bacterium]
MPLRELCLAACVAALALLLAGVASADWRPLKPPGHKVFFGVTDTGEASGFKSFARAVGKHPALIETYHPWDNSLHQAIPRWQKVRARPILHISTVEGDGHEVITPRGIALGKGDDYLLRLNRSFARHGFPAYVRPLGEPNRCLNAYAGVDCAGNRRPSRYSPKWYRQAFRRMYVLLHGGGKRRKINRKLKRLGLPRISRSGGREPRRLPKAPVALIWSPLPAGSPGVRVNRPAHYFPGARYVDWVGTDFYSRYPYWHDLRRFYKRFAKRHDKPFALTEWGLWGSDSPGFVRRLFAFARRHKHTRMLVYYQDFGSRNPFRIQNYPGGRSVLKRKIASRRFPGVAPRPPAKAPATGGVGRN